MDKSPRDLPTRPARADAAPARRHARALVWFRRDLRVADHPALARALHDADRVWCAFVLDSAILAGLPRQDRRVAFIQASLVDLDRRIAELAAHAGGGADARLIVRHADAADEIPRLARMLDVQIVYAHHDDDPAALARDRRVADALAADGRRLRTGKDHVIFERGEILTGAGKPYGVFTPYKNAWLKALQGRSDALAARPSEADAGALAAVPPALAGAWEGGAAVPALAEFGFAAPPPAHADDPGLRPGTTGGEEVLAEFLERIDDYDAARDFPARPGPSHLGIHLRFGTLSVRRLVALATQRVEGGSRGAQTWLSELIWRDFYHQVLHHHPHVAVRAYRADCDDLRWEEGPVADAHFAAWCEGRTGYPLVDAGMRQLNATGYMHNRLRMLTASFLTKDLGVSWRRGEAYFALRLNDFELASNNGGWQWAASTGCDAQPWFRIFNPVTQSERFDPQGAFIRRHVPELKALQGKAIHAPWRASPMELAAAGVALGREYPPPIVEHGAARQRTLARFGARGRGSPVVDSGA
ncbi:MAG: deoxyribodipyrimidine photo-lyase [Burkholderiaceae bacterium]